MTISQSGLSGSTIEIRVTINVDQNNEQIRIDDVNVTGKRYKETICLEHQLLLEVRLLLHGLVQEHLITYEWTPATGLSATNVLTQMQIHFKYDL